MTFAPKPGCPMCGIVSTALHAPSNSPRTPSFPAGSLQPEVLWRDDNFTAYREKANPVSSKGHVIIAFKSVTHPFFHTTYSHGYSAYMSHQYTPLCVSRVCITKIPIHSLYWTLVI